MAVDFEALAESLSMTDIVRLQDVLSRALVRKFEKRLALVFSDIVGSTPYFARFGDEAGRKMQQRHVDLLSRAITAHGGRIVDTAGDGAFLCFTSLVPAVKAMVAFQQEIARDNDPRHEDHRLQVRLGVHIGPVLTDGVAVSGDSVNFCARVASSAASGEVRLSSNAYAELTDVELKLKCRKMTGQLLKGVEGVVTLFTLDWLDSTRFPSLVKFEDGTEARLPSQAIIRFGRLREQDGTAANDVVLHSTDPQILNRISRWQFELHRRADGFVLRSVSVSPTEVDGAPVAKGEELPIRLGSKVKVGGVLELEFKGEHDLFDSTLLPP